MFFLRGADGRRPVFGTNEVFQTDPHWRDYMPFYEYFHGDTGPGWGQVAKPDGRPWWPNCSSRPGDDSRHSPRKGTARIPQGKAAPVAPVLVTVIDGEVVVGFDRKRLAALLGLVVA